MLLALVNESLQRHPWIAWAQPPVIAALEPHPVRTGAMPAYHAFSPLNRMTMGGNA